ncbi:hypothetical protein J437_LFUL001846 [Ladona fulva]|uniref:Uncharacterized protein n=1 Tax=Ladona fulva TaxID=123851 RepID=A0A8K0NWI3_LADFU|nr:hypothetical protein J437_LFUL001846 [Ladona fulva]
MVVICKIIQTLHFKEDLALLQKQCPSSLRIHRLSPFIDKDGFPRVGGRLNQSELGYEAKHPILLPKTHFWIRSARSVIRSRIFKCMTCYRCTPSNNPSLMGDLPEAHLSPTCSFLKSGMDYGGPFQVKVHTLKRAQLIKHLKNVTDILLISLERDGAGAAKTGVPWIPSNWVLNFKGPQFTSWNQVTANDSMACSAIDLHGNGMSLDGHNDSIRRRSSGRWSKEK